jgi:O-antigen/teichoic acid export membrane protein
MSDSPDPLASAAPPGLAVTPGVQSLRQRIHAWSWLVGRFLGVQIFVQLLGFASGILLIRHLSKADYAFFTIANTMLGAMNLLADSGIGSGLSSIGGRIWDQPNMLGLLIRTALHLRRTLGLVALCVVTPVLGFLLHRNGAPVSLILPVVILVLSSLSLELSNGVLSVIPRLLLQTGRLQRMDFLCALTRLSVIFLAVYIYLDTRVALAAATLSYFCEWLLLRRWVAEFTVFAPHPDPAMKREMLGLVKRQGPNMVYYCLQGQVTVWLISVFGSRNSVADIGALGRFAIIFTLIGSVMNSIVTPRYARIRERSLLLRRYWQIVGIYAIIVVSFVVFATTFPGLFLAILGNKYTNLSHELTLIVAVNGLSAIVGGAWGLNASRGWIAPTWVQVGIPVLFQIFCLHFVDVATISGAITFAASSLLPECIIIIANAMLNIRRHNRQFGNESSYA